VALSWLAVLASIGLLILLAVLNATSPGKRAEREEKKAYVACEDKILTDWAVQDVANARERLALVDKYCFGCWHWDDPTHGGQFSEYDVSRLKEVAQLDERTRAASKIGVTEAELIALDNKILQQCGHYPESTDKFPFGRTQRK
jgi:hypothetical protein